MNTISRFSFPDFTLLRHEDTVNHECDVGTICVNDKYCVIHMIRRKGLTFEGDFLVAKIFDDAEEKLLWEFSRQSFNGLGLLVSVNGVVAIALIGKGLQGVVEDVVLLVDILNNTPPNLLHKGQVKQKVAESLCRRYNLSDAERLVFKRARERERDEVAMQEELKRQLRKRVRAERVAQINARERITVYTIFDGRRRFGLPVVGDEWMSLPHNTHVVLVESYDNESNTVGALVEAFKVHKLGGGKKPEKGFPAPVVWDKSLSVKATAPKPLGSIVIEFDDDACYEVAVYASMEDIRQARLAGLNGGTYVTPITRMKDGRYEVYSVHTNEISTVGEFTEVK